MLHALLLGDSDHRLQNILFACAIVCVAVRRQRVRCKLPANTGTALLEAKFAITEYTRHCMLDAHLGPDKRQTQVSFLLSAGVHSPAVRTRLIAGIRGYHPQH